jgi:hypothetical protein
MQLELNLYRMWDTAKSVCGELHLGEMFWLYTLEPARVNPVIPGHPCIPAGRYQLKLTMSPHLNYVCPEVLDVPGRTAIRWHIGNRAEDVEGCAVLGETHGEDWVGNSRGAFNRLMSVLRSYESIWCTYHDGPPPLGEKNVRGVETPTASGETAPSGDVASGI